MKAVITAALLLQGIASATSVAAQDNSVDPAASAIERRPGYDADFDAQDYEYCLTCHGSVGQGNPAIEAPVLAGMEPWYLLTQLSAFRADWRGTHPEDLVGMEMYPTAKSLHVSELPAVAAYIGALTPQQAPAILDEGDAVAGATVYRMCVACHGATGEGQFTLLAPALPYQQDTYLVRQLEHFRDGVRGTARGDVRGAGMAAAAQSLSDADILDVVAYIKTLSDD